MTLRFFTTKPTYVQTHIYIFVSDFELCNLFIKISTL